MARHCYGWEKISIPGETWIVSLDMLYSILFWVTVKDKLSHVGVKLDLFTPKDIHFD